MGDDLVTRLDAYYSRGHLTIFQQQAWNAWPELRDRLTANTRHVVIEELPEAHEIQELRERLTPAEAERDEAITGLKVAREGLAYYEPDPQHYTVGVTEVLARLRDRST